jgi:hypothetical protein
MNGPCIGQYDRQMQGYTDVLPSYVGSVLVLLRVIMPSNCAEAFPSVSSESA